MGVYKIAFFHIGAACHGLSKRTKPMGGTESALIDMAEALTNLGHEVHIFTVLDEKGTFEGVFYHSYDEFESYSEKNKWDVFVGIRHLFPVLIKRWAKYQIYFTPDSYDQPYLKQALHVDCRVSDQNLNVGLYSLKFVSSWVDRIYCVGQWQAQTLSHVFQIPLIKFFISANGVWPEKFSPLPYLERKKRIVYASTPFRGLDYLLDYFPQLRKENPGLECWVMSGMQLYGLSKEEDQRQYSSIYQKAKQEGVRLLGPVSKPELYKIFSESLLMAYPNTFPETFCISVLEAQASGLPVVSTRLAALEERIENGREGFLISGHPSEKIYQENFIKEVTQILKDPVLWNRLSTQAILKSREYSYLELAKKWQDDFDLFFKTKQKFDDKKSELFLPKSEFFQWSDQNQKTHRIEISSQVIRDQIKKHLDFYCFKKMKEEYAIFRE